MRSPDPNDALWSKCQPDPTPDFHIAVVYDSLDRGARALRMCRHLIERFDGDFLFHVALCDFDAFNDLTQSGVAVRQAMRASLVVLAADAAPPDDFWSWLDCWAAVPRAYRAGVAAFTEGTVSSALIEAELRRRCTGRDVDLISPVTETITRSGSEPEERSWPLKPRAMAEEDYPDRGLNS